MSCRALCLKVPILVAVLACGTNDRLPAAESAAAVADPVAEVRAVFEGTVAPWNASNAAPVLATLDRGVVQLQPDTVYRGDALSANWTSYLTANTVSWSPTILKGAVGGDLGYLLVQFTERATPKAGGAATNDAGLTLEVYRRNASGEWKLVMEGWYPDPLVVPSTVTGMGPATADEGPVRAAFDAYVKGWNKDGVDGAIAMLDENVVQLGPTDTYVGKASLAASFRRGFEANDYQWTPEVLDIEVAGDLAYVRWTGTETSTPRAGGATTVTRGSGWNVFRRLGDGSWRLAGEAWFNAH